MYESLCHISISLAAAAFYQLRELPSQCANEDTSLRPLVNEAYLDLSGPIILLSLVACSIYSLPPHLLELSLFSYCFLLLSLVALDGLCVLLTQELCFKPGTPLCITRHGCLWTTCLIQFTITHEWKESYSEFLQDGVHIIKLVCISSHQNLVQSRCSVNVFWVCVLVPVLHCTLLLACLVSSISLVDVIYFIILEAGPGAYFSLL